MYRPKNWAIIKREYCNEKLKRVGGAHCETCPATPQTCNVSYEAGADAMLGALKKTGTRITKMANGYLTFIEDEE